MKKIISQISLIVFIMIIGMASVFVTGVNAESLAGLNVSSATVGGSFTVSLILPENVYGANCTVTVTYSDGSTSSQNLVYMSGMSDFPNQVTFSAKVAGSTTVSATGIKISDENANTLESGGSKSQTININDVVSNSETSSNSSSDSTASNNSSSTSSQSNDSQTTTTSKETEVVNPNFTDKNETVYAIQSCNVRSSCSTEISSNKIGGLSAGQSVTRTGEADGWSRISYNGKTAYVASRLLTTEKPAETENTTNTVDTNTVTEEDDVVTNEVSEEDVISKEEALNIIQEEVGVLPEVGNNVAKYMFYIISIIGLISIAVMNYKNRD